MTLSDPNQILPYRLQAFRSHRDPLLRSGCFEAQGFLPSTHSGLKDELASHFTGPNME
jgi:hypothetical protein